MRLSNTLRVSAFAAAFVFLSIPRASAQSADKPADDVREYSCSEDNVDGPHIGLGPGLIGPDGQRGFDKLAPLPPPVTKDHPAVTSIPE